MRHAGTLLTFAPPVKPLVAVEIDTATVFLDDPRAVTAYEAKMQDLEHLALDLQQSRDAFARWADAYDREAR